MPLPPPAAPPLQASPDRLSTEQRQILDLVLAGKNVFFTGYAGTGKSHVLKEIRKYLPAEMTMVTATTGLAGAAHARLRRSARGSRKAAHRRAPALITDTDGRMVDGGARGASPPPRLQPHSSRA